MQGGLSTPSAGARLRNYLDAAAQGIYALDAIRDTIEGKP
jgi:hypothetical protein